MDSGNLELWFFLWLSKVRGFMQHKLCLTKKKCMKLTVAFNTDAACNYIRIRLIGHAIGFVP